MGLNQDGQWSPSSGPVSWTTSDRPMYQPCVLANLPKRTVWVTERKVCGAEVMCCLLAVGEKYFHKAFAYVLPCVKVWASTLTSDIK